MTQEIISYNPSDGTQLGRVRLATEEDYETVVARAAHVFERWRMVPAPKRGEIARELGDELRAAKDELGTLVTLEMGKILAEGKGDVQEMIDIADFAVAGEGRRSLASTTLPDGPVFAPGDCPVNRHKRFHISEPGHYSAYIWRTRNPD